MEEGYTPLVRTRRCREDPYHQQSSSIGICTHSTIRKGKEDSVSTPNWSGTGCMYKWTGVLQLVVFCTRLLHSTECNIRYPRWRHCPSFYTTSYRCSCTWLRLRNGPRNIVWTMGSTNQWHNRARLGQLSTPPFRSLGSVIFVLVVVVMVVMLAHHQTLIKQKMLVQHLGRSWKIT